MEDLVKELIIKSLQKRLIGHDNIDNIQSNEELISQWLTGIMAVGYNLCDLEKASQDINEIQSTMMPQCSIEDTRAFVSLVTNRFPEEVTAFADYAKLRYKKSEDEILDVVKEDLALIDKGEFTLF